MTKKVVFLTDLHVPYQDHKALKAVLAYLKSGPVDELILGGDLLDFDFISSHNKGQLRKISGKSFADQYRQGKEVLDELLEAVGPASKKVWLEGNHEFRVERYLDVSPELEGQLEVPVAMELEARGVKWLPCWSKGKMYRLGKALFHHGLYVIEHHAKKMAASFGKNIFYGHIHDIQSHSLVLHGDDLTIVGQSCGCLCKYDQDYMRGKPSKWQQGFAVIYFQPDGRFNYTICRIFGGRFTGPDGRVWKG